MVKNMNGELNWVISVRKVSTRAEMSFELFVIIFFSRQTLSIFLYKIDLFRKKDALVPQ